MKRTAAPILWAMGMIVLILDSKTALAGATEGISMCMGVLIPGLFPLFVFSSMLTASLPRGGLMLAGILGGYPIGAGNAAQAWQRGELSRDGAEQMMTVCNCAGPAFIFGAAGAYRPGVLWSIYLISVAILWLILPKHPMPSTSPRPIALSQAVRHALYAVAGVCGWVVLMHGLLAVLDRWVLWILPGWARALAHGILELSNGIYALTGTDQGPAFVLAAGMVGFGGLCVMMQTAGVAAGLSLRYYFPGKLLQGCVCAALASMWSRTQLPWQIWGVLTAVGIFCVILLQKNEKRCGNSVAVGV